MLNRFEGEPKVSDEDRWISISDLKSILRDVRSDLLDNARVEEMIRMNTIFESDLTRGMVEIETVDLLLSEISRKIFGRSLGDLSPSQILEIRHIRKEIGIEGDFDPTSG